MRSCGLRPVSCWRGEKQSDVAERSIDDIGGGELPAVRAKALAYFSAGELSAAGVLPKHPAEQREIADPHALCWGRGRDSEVLPASCVRLRIGSDSCFGRMVYAAS